MKINLPKHKTWKDFYSNDQKFALDQWKGLSTNEQISMQGGAFNKQRKKPLIVLHAWRIGMVYNNSKYS
jgi:hypothetical protein